MYSPDKLGDSRPEAYINKTTMAELLAQANVIAELPHGTDKIERVEELNALADYAVGYYIGLGARNFYAVTPTGLSFEQEDAYIRGRFLKFYMLGESTVRAAHSDNDRPAPPYPPLMLGVHISQANFTSDITCGSYQFNNFVPVEYVSELAPLTELGNIYSGRKNGVDNETVLREIQDVVQQTREYIDNNPQTAVTDNIENIEPWDYRDPDISVDTLRRLQISVCVGQATVYLTNPSSGQPMQIDKKDFQFNGYYWASAVTHPFNKSAKPQFVFELNSTDNAEISEHAQNDPTGKPPLVYVPIDDAVILDISLKKSE